MIKSDCHMHTCFSADSEATVTSMLDAAVEKGLEGVCITDHMDLDFPETRIFRQMHFNLTWMSILDSLTV